MALTRPERTGQCSIRILRGLWFNALLRGLFRAQSASVSQQASEAEEHGQSAFGTLKLERAINSSGWLGRSGPYSVEHIQESDLRQKRVRSFVCRSSGRASLGSVLSGKAGERLFVITASSQVPTLRALGRIRLQPTRAQHEHSRPTPWKQETD